jgi:saccharopine dehydrogenase-like NADP-dependent oxidoreductase
VRAVADIDAERAYAVVAAVGSEKLTTAQIDVTDHAQTVALMRGHDAVVSCVTYFHNLQLARAAIEARTNFCDPGGNNAVVASELALDAEVRAPEIK